MATVRASNGGHVYRGLAKAQGAPRMDEKGGRVRGRADLASLNTARVLHNATMTTREIVLKTIEQLPETASQEEIQERINFVVGVHIGRSCRIVWRVKSQEQIDTGLLQL